MRLWCMPREKWRQKWDNSKVRKGGEYMDFFDYIFKRNASEKENPGKLSSYREAAELIC